MAKKRLNKKVALIGSMVLAFVAMVVIVVILYLTRDPDKFIKDGDLALQAARAATDEEVKEKEYNTAERNYHKARSLAKTDELRIEMLFKLVDIYLETDKWPNVLGCWDEIIRTDTKNIKARYGRLKYYSIIADRGVLRGWQEVASQTSELIEVADANILTQNTAEWESFAAEQKTEIEQMGPYLHLLRGRAALEMTKIGAVTDPDKSLEQAIEDLKKVRELVPDNPQPYLYLAQAAKRKGLILASRGNLEERQNSAAEAEKLLEQAVEAADADPRAHINLLTMKLTNMIDRRASKEQIQSLESDYLAIVNRFPSNAEAFLMLAGFYQIDPNKLDKAVDAIEKATELDSENVPYAISAANLHYRRFTTYGKKQDLNKALQIAQNALTLPDTQDKPGPWQWTNRSNRISLYMFLANCYIQQILGDKATEAQNQEWLTKAEQAVHEIEQLYGSGEEPQVVKWQGMLELAKGNKKIAVKKLYSTYEQLRASGNMDAQLSYTLADCFKNTAEVGAATQFLASALNAGIGWTIPEAHLEYAEVALQQEAWASAIAGINTFEAIFGPNKRSQMLRINALITANQLDEAEEKLADGFTTDDPNTIKLKLKLTQAKIKQTQSAITQKQTQDSNSVEQIEETLNAMTDELNSHIRQLAKLTEQLLLTEPNSAGENDISIVCDNYIAEGKIGQADDLVNQLLEYFPDNTMALIYKKLLSEPDPSNVSPQRRKEIEEQIRLNVADPITKAVGLGIFYQRNKEFDKATKELKKALGQHLFTEDSNTAEYQQKDITVSQKPQTPTSDMEPLQRLAASHLFETAIQTQNLELAEQIATLARMEDLDSCEGCFFAARLHMFKNQLKNAMAKLDECINQRPIFSHGFMLRSEINAILGNEHACLEDAQKASSLNPLDGNIARGLAFALYRRNQKLGNNVSSDQIIETRNALINAIRLNPRQWQLQSLYAEYTSNENPEDALAIRQRLQKEIPSTENAFLLAKMAMNMAQKEMNIERKKVLFEIAASSFKQALEYEPENNAVLDGYAEYYRITDQGQKAEELLQQSENKILLWNHYFQDGQFEKAKVLFEQEYQNNPNDSAILKGLLLIAEKTGDKEAAKKYFQQLLSLEETMENYLFQIQTFLKIGLVKEAEYKLAGFREKYPDEQRALLLEAWLAMKQGQLKKALALTNQNLQDNQDSALAWQLRGEINRLMANYLQAIDDLKRSKSLADDPLTCLALAKAYLRNGAEEDAITELRSTVDNPQAPAESRKMLEQLYWRLDKKAELAKFYNETLKKFPNDPVWHNQAGRFTMVVGDFSTAERLYQKALQIANTKKTNDEQYMLIANTALDGYLHALLAANKLNKLFEEAGKYVESNFAPTALVTMAEAKMKLKDKQNAINYCQKAIDKAGTNETLVYDILQRMHALLGTKEITSYCEQRLQVNPDSLATNFTMFNLAKINRQYNKAVEYIDKCLLVMDANNPNRLDFIVAKTQVLQLAYDKTADNKYLKRIITEYESLLAKMPNNTSILNNLAYMLTEENTRLAEALSYAKRAHEAMPNDPSLLDTYAFVLYKNGRTPEAAEFIQAALQQYEQNKISAPAEVYEHLGMIKEELNYPAEAIAAYEQALETTPEQLPEKTRERIEKAIQRLSK